MLALAQVAHERVMDDQIANGLAEYPHARLQVVGKMPGRGRLVQRPVAA